MTTVRAIRREELADYNKLSTICFTYTMKEEELAAQAMPEERLREIRGVFDEKDRLLGGMVQLEMDARFEGHDCRFLGIGGVVTDPAERRHGAIRRLFEEALPRLRDAGFVFSGLYPFSHVFYRKFGYEWGILQRNAEFKPECLRKELRRAASIRRVLPGSNDCGMRVVYEAYIRDKNLAVIRRDDHWKPLREGTPWGELKHAYVLLDEAEQPMAYWVGTMARGNDGTVLSIKDMAYTSRRGCEAIFAMLRTMNEVGTVRMMVPQDIELRMLLTDPYNMKETTSCGGMVRVMDVEKALALLPAPPVSGSFTVEVSDAQIPANNGRFMVSGDGEHVMVAHTEDEPDLRCTINGLSALIVGLMDFEEAVDSGMGEVLREEHRRFMRMFFCKRKAHLHNYF